MTGLVINPGNSKESACDGMHPFDSRRRADEVATRMNRSTRGRKAHPFKCPYCRCWHVGSHIVSPARVDRRRKEVESV